MLNAKNPLILAGLVTAWPVISLGSNDPNFEIPPSDDGLVATMVQAVLLIVVLGGIAVYLTKKFLPKMRPTCGREINIRETIHLGPHKTVHLVEVGKKTLFIGSTAESITMLADVTESLDNQVDDYSDRD